MSIILASLLLHAQPAAVAALPPAAAVDETRVDAARRLIAAVFPEPQRDQMLSMMLASIGENMRGAVLNAPEIRTALDGTPGARTVLDRFLQAEQEAGAALLRAGLPEMIEAMARAYARRFDASELGEIESFFMTDVGARYMRVSMEIMSDPDIAAWQQRAMSDSIRGTLQRLEGLGRDMRRLSETKSGR